MSMTTTTYVYASGIGTGWNNPKNVFDTTSGTYSTNTVEFTFLDAGYIVGTEHTAPSGLSEYIAKVEFGAVGFTDGIDTTAFIKVKPGVNKTNDTSKWWNIYLPTDSGIDPRYVDVSQDIFIPNEWTQEMLDNLYFYLRGANLTEADKEISLEQLYLRLTTSTQSGIHNFSNDSMMFGDSATYSFSLAGTTYNVSGTDTITFADTYPYTDNYRGYYDDGFEDESIASFWTITSGTNGIVEEVTQFEGTAAQKGNLRIYSGQQNTTSGSTINIGCGIVGYSVIYPNGVSQTISSGVDFDITIKYDISNYNYASFIYQEEFYGSHMLLERYSNGLKHDYTINRCIGGSPSSTVGAGWVWADWENKWASDEDWWFRLVRTGGQLEIFYSEGNTGWRSWDDPQQFSNGAATLYLSANHGKVSRELIYPDNFSGDLSLWTTEADPGTTVSAIDGQLELYCADGDEVGRVYQTYTEGDFDVSTKVVDYSTTTDGRLYVWTRTGDRISIRMDNDSIIYNPGDNNNDDTTITGSYMPSTPFWLRMRRDDGYGYIYQKTAISGAWELLCYGINDGTTKIGYGAYTTAAGATASGTFDDFAVTVSGGDPQYTMEVKSFGTTGKQIDPIREFVYDTTVFGNTITTTTG